MDIHILNFYLVSSLVQFCDILSIVNLLNVNKYFQKIYKDGSFWNMFLNSFIDSLKEEKLDYRNIFGTKTNYDTFRMFFGIDRLKEIEKLKDKKVLELYKIKKLDISGCGLTYFYPELVYLRNLEKLDISKNRIEEVFPICYNKNSSLICEIDEEVFEFKLLFDPFPKLKEFDFNENNPFLGYGFNLGFSMFTNLETLLLHQSIGHLPKRIGLMTKLECLDISEGILERVPKEICNLTNLKKLYLDCQKLTELPANFSNLSNLEVLTLDNNQLKKLPSNFSSLTKLEFMSIGCNSLDDESYKMVNDMVYNMNIGTDWF